MVLQNTFCSGITFCTDFFVSQAYKPRKEKLYSQVLNQENLKSAQIVVFNRQLFKIQASLSMCVPADNCVGKSLILYAAPKAFQVPSAAPSHSSITTLRAYVRCAGGVLLC